jgi:hypothetical protein|tara:strand:- start:258 stop:608 length:351 start_codon:yes stop_codon:yes gene_type:complete
MIITQDNIILFKTPPGMYNDCPDQATFDSMKSVYDDDMNIVDTKINLILEWETADINWFAGQHIEASYPQWKQSNLVQAGGAELVTMTNFITAVRAWSNQDPIPDPWDGSLESITP